MPLSIRVDTSADNVRVDLPDATSSEAGLLTAAEKTKLDSLNAMTTVVRQLDANIPAPTAVTISRIGSSSPPAIIVPAGVTRFFLNVSGLLLLNVSTTDLNALILGSLNVLDSTDQVLVAPNSNGSYTVTAGHSLTVTQTVWSLFTGEYALTQTTAADWGVQFQYYFT